MRTANNLSRSCRQALASLGEAIPKGPTPEAVHSARIALRRLREIARTFEKTGAFHAPRGFVRLLKHIARRLGRLRDEHVAASLFGKTPAAAGSAAWKRHPWNRMLGEGEKFLRRLERHAGEAADEIAQRMDRLERRAARRLGLMDMQDVRSLHKARIALRKARYLAQALAPGDAAMKKRAERLHEVESLLGRIHDIDMVLARPETKAEPRRTLATIKRRRTALCRKLSESRWKG